MKNHQRQKQFIQSIANTMRRPGQGAKDSEMRIKDSRIRGVAVILGSMFSAQVLAQMNNQVLLSPVGSSCIQETHWIKLGTNMNQPNIHGEKIWRWNGYCTFCIQRALLESLGCANPCSLRSRLQPPHLKSLGRSIALQRSPQ